MSKTNIHFHQGTDVTIQGVVKDSTGTATDITGATIESKIRNGYEGSVVATFTGTVTDAANGLFELTLTDTQTSAITVSGEKKSFVYDVKITFNDGLTRVFLYGNVVVLREVTRA